MSPRMITADEAAEMFRGRSVAIVGSAPSALENARGLVDSHEVVVRVNNYKLGERQGYRTDAFYSFFGSSIRKTAEELKRDGVRMCLCKCPDAKPISCEWHEKRGKLLGIDFRYIYKLRAGWWFCDTYVPTSERFVETFELLGRHVPTTGFAAILDVLRFGPSHAYLTGFDFFASGLHNVDERWRPGDPEDPIGHRPDLELAWLAANAVKHPVEFDRTLAGMIVKKQTEMAREARGRVAL